MSETKNTPCPECDGIEPVDRRDFIRVVGGGTASVVAAGGITAVASPLRAMTTPPVAANNPRPAEALVRELYQSLSNEQRGNAVYGWNHTLGNNNIPARLGMYNRPLGRPIGEVYSNTQQELIDRILHAISSGEDGYNKISRGGTWDGSRTLQGCGAYIFGDPSQGQYSWVFTGHHLTVRVDGNSVPGAAFGGPMYYGHSPNGYSSRNVFYFQTQAVRSVFDSLSAQQRQTALVNGSPGEHMQSVQFRQQHPGLPASELTADQRQLVEQTMRTILSPYRQEDADEVMEIIRRNGGLQQLHLAFYRERNSNDDARWHFWRIEGPGFVWNYRVLPHVHTYVNISSQI